MKEYLKEYIREYKKKIDLKYVNRKKRKLHYVKY